MCPAKTGASASVAFPCVAARVLPLCAAVRPSDSAVAWQYASAAVPSAVKRRDQARKRKEDASLRTQLGKFDPHRPSIRMPRSRDDGYAMLREWILDSESRIQSAKTGQTVVPTAPMETAFPLPPMVDHAAGADAGSAMPLSARASSTSRVVGVPSAGGRPATVGSGSLTARGTAGERGITARLLQRMRKRPREDMVPETLYLPYTSRRPMPSPVGIPTLRAFKENHLNDAATSLTEPRTMLATAKRSGGGVAGGGGGSAGDGGASPRRRGSVLVGPASPKRGTLARKASVMGMLKRRKPDSKKRKKAAAMAKNKRLLREMEDDHVKRMDPSEVAALRTEFNPVRKIGFPCHSFEARKGQLQEQLLQTLEQLDRERGLTLKRKFKVLWQGRDQLQKHSFLQEMKIMRLAAEADRLERHIKNYRGTMWYPKLLAHVVVQGRDSLPVEHFMTSYVKFVIDAGFSFERAMLYALVKALTLKELSMFESQRVLAFLRAEVGIPLSEWESFFASNGLPPPQEVVEQHAVHAKQLAAVLSQPRIADSMRAWLSRSKAAGTDRAFAGFHE
eukprot:PLAT10067.1.p1 GENE.PLAT10067.1~~PLAT10067.1.p1  ORF type:complete len:563 (-),score=247.38 PLAT10067.1:108-1796(-)